MKILAASYINTLCKQLEDSLKKEKQSLSTMLYFTVILSGHHLYSVGRRALDHTFFRAQLPLCLKEASGDALKTALQ